MSRLGWAMGLLLALACGCAPDCTAVDCVAPITIQWTDSDLAKVDRARVCVDDACNDVSVQRSASGGMVLAGGGGRDVRVRLVARSADGSVIADLAAAGRKSRSGCCEWITFSVRGGALAITP